jgi:hypothetical protein
VPAAASYRYRFASRTPLDVSAASAATGGTAVRSGDRSNPDLPRTCRPRASAEQRRFTCVPIVAARSVEQLEENVGSVDVSLSSGQRERITAAYG